MYSVLCGKTNNSPSASAVNFTAIGIMPGYGYTSDDSTSTIAREVIAVPTTLSNFRVECTTAPGIGKSYTYTIRKNLTDTVLAVTIADGNTVAIDNTHSVAFAAGDIITVGLTPAGTPASPGKSHFRVLADAQPTNAQSIMSISNGVSSAGVTYSRLFPTISATSSTEATAQIVMPCAGVFNNLRILSPTAPTVGSYVFTLRVNGVDQALTATLETLATTASDLAHPITVAAGDTVSIKITPTGSPSLIDRTATSLSFAPTTFGDSFMGSSVNSGVTVSTTVQNFMEIFNASNPGVTEATYDMEPGPMMLKNLYVKLQTAPGAGKSYVITVRKNGVDTGLTLTIADAATTGNVAVPVQIDQGDKINLSFTPSGTPTSPGSINWGLGISFKNTNFLPFFD